MDTPEKQAAIRAIRRLMDFWHIQPEELAGPLPARKAVDPLPAPPPPQHYRHPIYEYTWDGKGAQPQWLRDALLKEGYLVQDLRVSTTD